MPQWSSINADGVEDSLTATPVAAKSLMTVLKRARLLTAIELIVAAQAIDLRGTAPAPLLAKMHACIRAISPGIENNRPLGDEINWLTAALDDFQAREDALL